MRLPRIVVLTSILFVLALSSPSRAAAADDILDSNTLIQLEARAEKASPREQCFLFTELIQDYTAVAGKQMADGDMSQAGVTLTKIQLLSTRVHMVLAKDTKRLKNAEMAMHAARTRLNEYLHHLSSEDRETAETTLKELDKVHEELLAEVFAH